MPSLGVFVRLMRMSCLFSACELLLQPLERLLLLLTALLDPTGKCLRLVLVKLLSYLAEIAEKVWSAFVLSTKFTVSVLGATRDR